MRQNNLKALREKMGLSQAELGEKLGISQQSVYAWESGDAFPRLQMAIALAEFYGVSIDYLFGRSEKTEKPIVDDNGLRAWAIKRVSDLSDPALERVRDFLAGLQAGQEIGSIPEVDRDSDDESSQ